MESWPLRQTINVSGAQVPYRVTKILSPYGYQQP